VNWFTLATLFYRVYRPAPCAIVDAGPSAQAAAHAAAETRLAAIADKAVPDDFALK
jgi:hypothetical protein